MVNLALEDDDYRMTTLQDAINNTVKGDYQVVFDLKSAFHHIRLHPSVYDLMGFQVKQPDGQFIDQEINCSVMMTEDQYDDSLNVYTCTDDDPPGLAVLDTACRKTMHGTPWRERVQPLFEARELKARFSEGVGSFSGVGGSAQSVYEVEFPVGIASR